MGTSINSPFPDKCWLLSSYSYSKTRQFAEMATKRGNARLRIGTTGPTTVNASLGGVSDAELAQWDGFVQYDLAGGMLWFNAQVKASGTLESRELQLVDPSESITITGRPDNWTITCTVRTRVGTEMDAGTYAIVADIGMDAYYEMMLAALIAVNTEISA